MREINVVKRARTHGAQLCRLYKLNLKLDKYVWICSINKKNYETKEEKKKHNQRILRNTTDQTDSQWDEA